jgi:predicted secreted protein
MKNGIIFFAAGVNSDVINTAAGWHTQDLVISKVSIDIFDSDTPGDCYNKDFATHSDNKPGVITTENKLNVTYNKVFWE